MPKSAESQSKTETAHTGRRPHERSHHTPKKSSRSHAHRAVKHARSSARSLVPELEALVYASLEHSTFIVFDIETTGGNPERNGITEICALKVHNGKVIDRFYSLVNPLVSIPPIVRKMTGITNNMVKDAPIIDEIFPDFSEFIGDHTLVSHNTIGDLIFLRHFARETIGRDLRNFFLCTHLLVEKIAAEAPDKSLKGLSKFFGLSGSEFHRAEADALQTWELFKVLQKRLTERGVTRVDHAIRLQGDLDSSLRLGWAVPQDKIEQLPTGTGIFYLFDHERRLLFLSSAISIAKEVAKFSRPDLIPRQILKLALRSYDLQAKRLPNLFSAMLAECEDREKHGVQADPSLFHQRQVQVIGVYEERGAGRRLSVGPLEPGIKAAFGPVKERKQALDFLADLAEILGEKTTRTGMLISDENFSVVMSLLSGTLNDLQRKVEGRLWRLRLMFWRKEAATEQRKKLDAIASLMGLSASDQPTWPSVEAMDGMVIVPDEVSGHSLAYLVVRGIPRSVHHIRGPWKAKLQTGGFGKRLLHKLEKDVKADSSEVSLSSADVARINALLWWLQFGRSKDHGVFLTKADLGELLHVESPHSSNFGETDEDSP